VIIVYGIVEASARFTKMIESISHFANVDMRGEFRGWQRESMHRKWPSTRMSKWSRHKRSATSIIRPHSKFEMARSAAYQAGLSRQRVKQRRKKFRAQTIGHPKTSTRPILRQSIEREFMDRLSSAFFEKIKW
jgi:hypothetical protein